MAAGVLRARPTRTLVGAALAAVFACGVLSMPTAPAQPGAGANPDCGAVTDVDPNGRLYLWQEVNGVTPDKRGHNQKVVFPVAGVDNGYAVKGSGNDQLLIPTLRVRGIECPTIWQPGALNYWQYAWDEGAATIPADQLALGVNSEGGRKQDQLHVHLARLDRNIRTELDGQLDHIADNPSLWPRAVVTLAGRRYRALHVPGLGGNLFALTKDAVAPTDIRDQSLLVTRHPKGGYIVLDSQSNPKDALPGGVNSIDSLLYTG